MVGSKDEFGRLISSTAVEIPFGCGAFAADVTDAVCLGFGDRNLLGDHVAIRSVPGACGIHQQSGATCLGLTTRVAFVLASCGANMHQALCTRHGQPYPKTAADIMDAYPRFAAIFAAISTEYMMSSVSMRGDWEKKWPGSKLLSILESEIFDIFQPSKVKCFVKREVYHKLPTKARLIQAYSRLVTQARFGPNCWVMQKLLSHVVRRFDVGDGIDVTFACGLNGLDLSMWMDSVVLDGVICFVERDGERWDSTMNPLLLEFKNRLYSILDREFAGFADQCIWSAGAARTERGVFRYAVGGTVKSGHNDTTLGNSLINAAIAVLACLELGIRASVIVAGDDMLLAVYGEVDLAKYLAVEAKYGIIPVGAKFYQPKHVSFMSGVWVESNARFWFVPKPGRMLARLWWTVNPPTRKRVDRYKRGVARGLMPTCGKVPVIADLIVPFDTEGEVILSDKARMFGVCAYDIKDDIWAAFAARYGLNEFELRATCSRLRSLANHVGWYRDDVTDRIMTVDLADPNERPCF